MAIDRRTVLNALRAELAFIQSGEYRHPSHAAWRPQFVFEDSPTCLNHNSAAARKPCSECVLASFFPPSAGTQRVPCRFIPLSQSGETIDSLYRTGTRDELESALIQWLNTTIQRLEREEAEDLRSQDHPVIHVEATFTSRQSPDPELSTFSTCANPDCRTPLVYGEGHFFRFRQGRDSGNKAPNTHSVQHLWLCGPCSGRFTLQFREGTGVVIRNRPDVACGVETSRPLSAA